MGKLLPSPGQSSKEGDQAQKGPFRLRPTVQVKYCLAYVILTGKSSWRTQARTRQRRATTHVASMCLHVCVRACVLGWLVHVHGCEVFLWPNVATLCQRYLLSFVLSRWHLVGNHQLSGKRADNHSTGKVGNLGPGCLQCPKHPAAAAASFSSAW